MTKAEEVVKDVVYYLSLPYAIIMRIDEEGNYIARIQELEGCLAHGSDPNEALATLREIQELWIEERLSTGHEIPEPQPEEDLPSGKWVQRVPRTLHLRLTELAKHEQVSLNQLVTSILSEAVVTVPFKKLFQNYILTPQLQHAWRDNLAEYGDWHVNAPVTTKATFETVLSNAIALFSTEYKSKHDYDPKDTFFYKKDSHNKGPRKGQLQLAGR